MISVTVAAQGRSKRLIGGHLRAYGSGRLSMCELDGHPEKAERSHTSYLWCSLMSKLCEIAWTVLCYIFPFLFEVGGHPNISLMEDAFPPISTKATMVPYSSYHSLNDSTLLRIFSFVDSKAVPACEAVCKKWNRIIKENNSVMSKIQKDQIRILFDEGEIVIYPVDEKKCPKKYPMPSLQILAVRLRHLKTLSLFVRGLIPVESAPVLRSLSALDLHPQQIFFIWCKFSPASIPYLGSVLHRNIRSLVDIGLEECTPTSVATDALIAPHISSLTSLRVWNTGKGGSFPLSDETLLAFSKCFTGKPRLETLDLASCDVTTDGLFLLICAWSRSAKCNITLSFDYCPHVDKDRLFPMLLDKGILFINRIYVKNGHCLTLFL